MLGGLDARGVGRWETVPPFLAVICSLSYGPAYFPQLWFSTLFSFPLITTREIEREREIRAFT